MKFGPLKFRFTRRQSVQRIDPAKGATTRARRRRLLLVSAGAAVVILGAAGSDLLPMSPFRGWAETMLLPGHAGTSSSEAVPTREARLARARARMAAEKAASPAGLSPAASNVVVTAETVGPMLPPEAAAHDSSAGGAAATDSASIQAALDRGPAMVYSAGGRDPFRSLLLETPDSTLCDVDQARLVGVAWNDEQMVAMIEDHRGQTWSLREGDRVMSGRIVGITKGAAIIDTWLFGNAQRKVLQLIPKSEESKP